MRYSRGTAAAEFPILLWVLLVLILFPMTNLATCCLRSYFFYGAVHNAALAASKATSFEQSFPPNLSSIDTANQTINRIASQWSGLRLNNVTVQMVITNINTNVETVRNDRLTTPPDATNNIYHVRVTATGEVDPLLTFNLGVLGNIPGLTGPIPVTMNDQNFIENTQGLTR